MYADSGVKCCRGVLFAMLFSIPIWLCIGVCLWLVTR
jgi:hypothetical protein